MNSLICERSRELQQSNSQSKAPRGKRLPNKTGLNITDDNLVYTTVKDNLVYTTVKENEKETSVTRAFTREMFITTNTYREWFI